MKKRRIKIRQPVDRGDYFDIPLQKGCGFAKIDKDDWKGKIVRNWSLVGQRHKSVGSRRYGKTAALARLIMKAPKGKVVDHIDGDVLDNRKANLRVCSNSDNSRNRKKHSTKHGKYKGAFFRKPRSKWIALLRKNYRIIYLGSFNTEKEAALAYDAGAKRYFGKFARLNFPEAHLEPATT